MSCNAFGPLVLDETTMDRADVQAHLGACAHCQALGRAHRAAEALRALPFELPNRPKDVPVRALWRRRLILRGTFAGLVAGVVAAAFWAMPRRPLAEPPRTVASPSVATGRAAPAAGEARDTVRSLILEVDSYTQQDATAHDPALAAFGALPTLLTPEAKH